MPASIQPSDHATITTMRRRIILVCIVVMTCILLCIIGVAYIVGYNQLADNADSVLNLIADNKGTIDAGSIPLNTNAHSNQNSSEQAFMLQSQSIINSETPYESRFFIVSFTTDGNYSLDLSHIAAVDSEDALELATEALEEWHGRNAFIGDFRYTIVSYDNATHVIMLDRGRQIDQFHTLLLGVGLSETGIFAIMLLAIFIWSGHVIAPVAESYAKQRRFIADVGHDIKTPITVIQADADVLREMLGDELDDDDKEWLDDITQQCKKMTGLVNDLITLSKMDATDAAEQKDIINEPADFSRIVHEETKSYAAIAKTEGKKLEVSIENGIMVSGSKKTLQRLISVLCDNAMKYSVDSSTISINLARCHGTAELSVINAVEDIDKNSISRWFDRFYRADTARNHDDSTGYGIGLSLAANAVKSMHGTIQALLSKDGKTLTMLVRLPLYKEHRHHRHMLRLPQAGNEQAHEDLHDDAESRSSEKAYDKHEHDDRHKFHDKHDALGHAG